MSIIRKGLLLLILLLAVVSGFWVVLDNPQPVTFQLLGFRVSTLPLGIWALLVFLLGCAIGILFSLCSRKKRR